MGQFVAMIRELSDLMPIQVLSHTGAGIHRAH
jgi:hypothetical protein